MTLNALLDEASLRWPARIALLVEEGPAHEHVSPCCRKRDVAGSEHAVAYDELRCLVLRAAEAFRASGIARGDRVAILHRNGLGFVVAYFGLLRLGAVAVPINFMVQKSSELRYMLSDCGARAIVTQRAFLREVNAARVGLAALETVWMTEGPCEGTRDFWAALADARTPQCPKCGAGEDAEDAAAPDDVAAVLYTSGTTGEPKGVMLTHANMVANADSSILFFDLSENDVFLCLLPMFHTFAWTACIVLPLRIGAKVVVVTSITPPKPWLMRMARHGVTCFFAVPQLYAVLAKQATGLKRWVLRWYVFRKVRFCVAGAAPLPERVSRDFLRAVGHEILEGYGLTETSPIVSVNRPGRSRRGSAGPPIDGVSLRIVDGQGCELPPGEEGEICVRGHNIMKGYLNRPEDTRAVLSEDGWLRTGDVGIVDADGFLHIRDRIKDMIIIKGLKVFSAQVEAAILEHPGVQEAAVVGIPDDVGDETIKAFVVLRPGSKATKSDLLQHCRQRLDPYKRPRDIEVLGEMPKNSLQKVLKRELRRRELDRRVS
ncbi:MAG: AMP-binding protein [Elusimicrobiota bacterium]|jgi:long-chain acyl-CoA synthetase